MLNQWGLAQSLPWSNIREKTIPLTQTPVYLDSFSILDFEVLHPSLDTSYYEIRNNFLAWKRKMEWPQDSIRVRFRVAPFNLAAQLKRMNLDTIRNQAANQVIGYAYRPFESASDLLEFGGLQYNGSFARGLSFGNNQDLVLNSSFNLQLAGSLGDEIEILAAITDENIPLQPEGNTQQLREFDKIYVQLSKGSHQVTAGDYELVRPPGYFMNYYKKLQGGTWQSAYGFPKGGTITNKISGAISRGKFGRNNLIQQEGNQGPYRLRGSENERFIIVLAGSEKVWIDGVQMKRGLENDYVIDYNRGEITFTSRRIITKDLRIVVEFEYSDLNFNRTLYALNTEYQKEKLALHFNLYSEQDGKNSIGNFSLTDTQKEQLKNAGDDFENTFVSSLDTLASFSEVQVSYELRDTIVACGRIDSVLQFSNNPDLALYTAQFTFVGQGNGHYILDTENLANERIYRWVAPDSTTCLPRGDYSPAIQLSAPKQRQLYSIGGTYQFNQQSALTAEIAMSNQDQNRFSDLDQTDNQGVAVYSQLKHALPLSRKENGWQLGTDIQYEFKQEYFQPLNPYRSPEFLRDWNLANVLGISNLAPRDEQLLKGNIWLGKQTNQRFLYEFSTFDRDSVYNGQKHRMQFQWLNDSWEVNLVNDYLTANEVTQQTTFHRPEFQVAKTLKKLGNWRIGSIGRREKSKRISQLSDTLNTASFYFDQWEAFLESPSEGAFQLQLNVNQRLDYVPSGNDFLRSAKADNFSVNGNWQHQKWLQLKAIVTYRDLSLTPGTSTIAQSESGQTLLGRTDINLNLARGAIRLGTNYEIGSGQEPRLDFAFIKVPQGQGTHIWLDSLYNNDGIVQPNEMELAPFQDLADYIKVSTFTDQFIQTNNVTLNQSLQFNPKAIWFDQSGFKKWLSHLATQSTLKVNRKTLDLPAVNQWNPYDLNVTDSALVAATASIRHILFVNRGSPVFDLQFGQLDNRSKILQTSGFESRQRTEYFFKSRFNLSNTLTGRANFSLEERLSDSEFFNNKDFFIESLIAEPAIDILASPNLRFAFTYTFQNSENLQPESDNEALQQHELKLGITFNQSAKTAIRSQGSWVQIAFDGVPNSPVGFALLNGLQTGRNLLWNISIDQQIAKNVRLNLSYDGRKTGTNRMIHVGRAQVAAVF